MNKSNRESLIASKPAERSPSDFLTFKYIMGFRVGQSLSSHLFNLSTPDSPSKRILYVAGNIAIIAKLETKAQIFIPSTEESLGISAIAVSKSKSLIAVAEESSITGIITIYEYKNDNVKKRKTLVSKESQSTGYSCMTFTSNDNSRYLCTLTLPLNYKVLIWEWEKSKIRAMIDISGFNQINGLFIPENDPSLLFLYGQPSMGLSVKCVWLRKDHETMILSTKNDIIKDFLKIYNRNFLSHCVLGDNSTIFGNEKGEFILFTRQYEIKSILPCSPLNNTRINCLVKIPKGFAAGCSNFQILRYERKDNDLKGTWERSAECFSNAMDTIDQITTMVDLDQESTIIGSDTGELLLITQTHDNTFKVDPAVAAFHSGELIDIDVCERKPLLATCASDNIVKIWNYQEYVLEYEKSFDKDIFGLSFHPTGLFLAISFKDRVKVMSNLHDEMALYLEVTISDCKIVKFSNGGHLLALVCDNTLNVFDFYNGDFRNNLIIKSGEGSTINSIKWAEDDFRIYASCADGTIYLIEIRDNLKTIPFFNNSEPTLSFVIWNEYKTKSNTCYLACILADKGVRIENFSRDMDNKDAKGFAEISGYSNLHAVNNPKSYSNHPSDPFSNTHSFTSKNEVISQTHILRGDESYTSIAISFSGVYFIVGTGGHTGVVKVFTLPELTHVCDLNLSKTAIKKIVITSDDSMFFVICKDNSLFFIDLNDKKFKEKKEKEVAVTFLEEFLVDEKQLKAQIEQIESLQTSVVESEKIAELNMKKTRIMKEEFVKTFEAKMRQVVEERQKTVKEIEMRIEQLTEQHNEHMKDVSQKHCDKKESLEGLFNQRMEKEEQKYKQTKGLLKKIRIEHNACLDKIHIDYKSRTKELNEQYSRQLAEIDLEIEIIEAHIKETMERYNSLNESAEHKLDVAINERKISHEQELERLIRDKNKREYELNLAKFEYNNMIQQKNQAEKENRDNTEQIKTLATKIKELKREKEANGREIEEREKTIVQKKERINELINKKHELDKFKYVLHYKIEELKKEKGPREIEIAKMKQQLETMQQEIYLFAKNNSQLKLSVSEYNLRLQGQTKLLKETNYAITDKSNILTHFKKDISSLLVASIDDFKELKKGLVNIYNVYVENHKHSTVQNEKKKTFTEQRSHVENCLKTLKDKFGRSISLHKNDHKRVMKENVDLISAINELKREKKLKSDNISRVEIMKRDAQKEIDLAVRIKKNSETINELKSRLQSLKKIKD